MDRNDDYKGRLKESGLKNTKHRTAILAIMKRIETPMSADEVYLKLKEQEISINLSTVYRILEVLTEKGLLLKHSILNDARALYEYNSMEHKHYLICIGCKKMLSINHCPLKEFEKSLEKETDFIIEGHKLDIYGYCSECQKNNQQE